VSAYAKADVPAPYPKVAPTLGHKDKLEKTPVGIIVDAANPP
jgi:hypothetical protein